MKVENKKTYLNQAGFSLVELMVGLVIGLLATLVIMQVFSAFEGQKRTTTGGADAQTNGSIALYSLQRDVQIAGYGLPASITDTKNASLNCLSNPVFVDPDTGASAGLFPLVIQDGAVNDTIIIRYSTTAVGAVPVKIVSTVNATAAAGMEVENNIGCHDKDVVLISNGNACVLTQVQDANGNPDTLKNISLNSVTTPSPLGTTIVAGAKLACMGNWAEHRYEILNNQLVLDGQPVISEIMNMQAQYGVSDVANSNQVTSWVNAVGAWAAPSVADRNRIKAIRIALVARNNLLEKGTITAPCTTAQGTVNNGPCAWDDTGLSPSPQIDLSANVDWQKYRYKAFETIIPLRNMIWSKGAL